MLKTPILLLLFLNQLAFSQQTILQFDVSSDEYSYLDCPVNIGLSSISPDLFENLYLYEDLNNKLIAIPFQIESGKQPQMWFIVDGVFTAGSLKTFVLIKKQAIKQEPQIQIQRSNDELEISSKGHSILNYRLSEKLPPKGVDKIYKRSAYIHPLYSPEGEVLTRIQPPDHYHHYGIWNPYTKTHIKGREIDYWNLAKGNGTVRFAGLLSTTEGNLYGGFSIHKEHIDFGHSDFERVTINEKMDVRYWINSKNKSRYILDYKTILSNAIEDTIIFDAYRYGGGIGFRATEKWVEKTSTVLTSEGKDRLNADGSRARWCIIEGVSSVEEGRSGILFMSHPFNREHPEPMRVWPIDTHEGQMFFEFCTIRHKSWEIIQGQKYSLNYRMIVFDGEISAEEAEMYWNSFAHPPKAVLQSIN